MLLQPQYVGELEVRPPDAPTTNPSAAREPPRARHPRGEAAARIGKVWSIDCGSAKVCAEQGWNAGRADYYSTALQVAEETPVISPHPFLNEPTVIIEPEGVQEISDD